MTHSCVLQVRATGVGHVTRRDAERIRDETSGIGPGSSGCRDGVGTGRGTSHNTSSAMLDKGGTKVPPVSGLVDLGLPCAVGRSGTTNGSYSFCRALSQYWLTALN